MIVLDKIGYYKAGEALRQVIINNLFARSVVEKKVNGSVYVDNVDSPKTFYIVHPYGMSLLFGDHTNKEFNARFREHALNTNKGRDKHEWMQAFPKAWDNVLGELFKDHMIRSDDNSGNIKRNIIELNTRVNFKFNEKSYNARQTPLDENIKVIRTDRKIFDDMKGSVVPYYFWNSADDFLENGIGFSVFYKDRLASTAYSSFIHDDKLELGIETMEEFRGKGFAKHACAALIDYSLKNKYEPVWACRLENIGSYKLALKLGFEDVARIPYYRLND
jgi:GNAT superfamily N-acetyltransferase